MGKRAARCGCLATLSHEACLERLETGPAPVTEEPQRFGVRAEVAVCPRRNRAAVAASARLSFGPEDPVELFHEGAAGVVVHESLEELGPGLRGFLENKQHPVEGLRSACDLG